MVTYSDNHKYAYFQGVRFCRDDRTGYYQNSTIHKRLHRFVYEHYYGGIPEGYDVHHIDGDKSNNEPANLQAIERHAHKIRHGEMLTDERRAAMRDNMIRNAVPAATKWHKSPVGHVWHLEHYAKMRDTMHQTVSGTCAQCGKAYIGQVNQKFCSNACKSAWRRNNGIDDVKRICVICGKEYYANKYAKGRTCSRSCARRLCWNKKHQAQADAAGL